MISPRSRGFESKLACGITQYDFASLLIQFALKLGFIGDSLFLVFSLSRQAVGVFLEIPLRCETPWEQQTKDQIGGSLDIVLILKVNLDICSQPSTVHAMIAIATPTEATPLRNCPCFRPHFASACLASFACAPSCAFQDRVSISPIITTLKVAIIAPPTTFLVSPPVPFKVPFPITAKIAVLDVAFV